MENMKLNMLNIMNNVYDKTVLMEAFGNLQSIVNANSQIVPLVKKILQTYRKDWKLTTHSQVVTLKFKDKRDLAQQITQTNSIHGKQLVLIIIDGSDGAFLNDEEPGSKIGLTTRGLYVSIKSSSISTKKMKLSNFIDGVEADSGTNVYLIFEDDVTLDKPKPFDASKDFEARREKRIMAAQVNSAEKLLTNPINFDVSKMTYADFIFKVRDILEPIITGVGNYTEKMKWRPKLLKFGQNCYSTIDGISFQRSYDSRKNVIELLDIYHGADNPGDFTFVSGDYSNELSINETKYRKYMIVYDLMTNKINIIRR